MTDAVLRENEAGILADAASGCSKPGTFSRFRTTRRLDASFLNWGTSILCGTYIASLEGDRADPGAADKEMPEW